MTYGDSRADEKSEDEGWERNEGTGWDARVNTYRGCSDW
jgi:hypothetical protein